MKKNIKFGWEYKKHNRRQFITLKLVAHCDRCGSNATTDKLFSYVDGNNRAITKHSPNLCVQCIGYDPSRRETQ